MSDMSLLRDKCDVRSALFCDITQRIVAIPYRRFGNLSVRNYHYTLRNIPEESRSHLLHGGSLKSQKGDDTKDNGLGNQNGGHQTANVVRRAL